MARRLLLLNGISALGAVIYHASGWGYTSLFWWTDRYAPVAVPDFSQMGGVSYYALRIAEQLIVFAVPAFLFVSGYFVAFASGRNPAMGWPLISGRLKTLLPPYIFWTVLIVSARGLEGHAVTPAVYAEQIAFGQAAPPFYYVPVLIQLYLLAPLLVWAMKRDWKLVLIAAALVQGTVQIARYPVLLGWDLPWATWVGQHAPAWFFPHLLFWFTLGVFAGLNPATFTNWLNRWARVLPWLAVTLGIAAFVEWEVLQRLTRREWLNPSATLVDALYSGAFIFAFLTVLHARVPARRQIDAVGERSFGLYLIHAPVLELIARSMHHVGPVVLAHQAMFQPLLIVGGVGVPIALMALINRSRARPFYSYLFG